MEYYIASNFSAVAFNSIEDLQEYADKRVAYSQGSTVGKILIFDYLPHGVTLLN